MAKPPIVRKRPTHPSLKEVLRRTGMQVQPHDATLAETAASERSAQAPEHRVPMTEDEAIAIASGVLVKKGFLGVDGGSNQPLKTAITRILSQPGGTVVSADDDELVDDGQTYSDADVPVGPVMQVCSNIGAERTPSGQRVAQEYEWITKPLPLTTITVDVPALRQRLIQRYPHAAKLIDRLLMDAMRSDGQGIHWTPTVILGGPGSGKSSLLRDLLDGLGLGYTEASVAGATDSHILGVSRGWSTGMPSMIVEAMRRHSRANVVMVLNEIDKITQDNKNGDLMSALLPVLEPRESKRWQEPYLCTEMDISRVSWLCTANDLKGIPAPLRSRVRVLRMPEPEVEHLRAYASVIIEEMANELGVHPMMMGGPLDGIETKALERTFGQHRDLRILRRQIESVINLRSMPQC